MEEVGDFLIRDIPDEMYVKMKQSARKRKMSINSYVLFLIEQDMIRTKREEQERKQQEDFRRRLEALRKRRRGS